MYIILLGAPGSGKGTQAELLSKSLKIPHISTGAILRSQASLDPKLRKIMAEGKFLSDEMMLSIIKKRFKESDCKKGWILDGYPRTTVQAENLEAILSKTPKVLLLVLDDDEIKIRLSNRRTCENCGAIYHLINNPPEVENKCDQCGGKLYQRDDDKPEVIKNRLKIYHEKTAPLISFYKEMGALIEIPSSEETPEEIYQKIKDHLR